MQALFWKFIKFGLVGLSGVFIDFGTTYLAKEKLGWPKYLANSLGFALAATSNFLLNRLWTFESYGPGAWQQYFKFIAIALLGLVVSNGAIYLLNEKRKLNFYLSKAIAVGVVMIWNFSANYYFTFRVLA